MPGFDQTADFIVPDEFAPKVVIEAKIAEDDGTARDKVARVQHLGELSRQGQRPGTFKYEVVACIGGRVSASAARIGLSCCRPRRERYLR